MGVIDVRRLQILREVERHGTVNAAAAALHLTPSAVSQQMAALARETGVPVLERNGRNVRPTDAAQVMLTHADRLFTELERLDADLEAHRGGQVGTVRVGAFETAAAGLVVPALVTLLGDRPGLEVQVVQVDAPACLDELAAGRLDVAVYLEHVEQPASDGRRLARWPLLVDTLDALLPAGHPLADRSEVALGDLAGETWIGALARTSCRRVVVDACGVAGFVPRMVHEVDDWHLVGELVAAGLGVALLPRLAHLEPRRDLVVRPLSPPVPARRLFAATRAGGEGAPARQALLDALRTIAGQHGEPVSGLGPSALSG